MADMRQLMEDALDEIALDESQTVRDFVREAFTLTKTKELTLSIVCKHCHREGRYTNTVDIPDYKERTKAIEMLLNQAKGKPQETVKVRVEIGARALEEMTLAELDAEEQAILQAHPELAAIPGPIITEANIV